MAFADLVVTGADVWTADAARSWTDAVAVRGDRIVALGAEAVGELVGPGTRVMHRPGAMVVPGFQDAHVHAPFAGRNLLHVWLNDIEGRQAYLDAHRALRGGQPRSALDRRRRVGDGALPGRHAAQGGPRRGRAGPAGVPDEPRRPRRLGNSRALEVAGITAGTPDPADGRIERDPGRASRPACCTKVPPTATRTATCRRRPERTGSARPWRPSGTCTRSASPAGRTRGSRRRRSRPTGRSPQSGG